MLIFKTKGGVSTDDINTAENRELLYKYLVKYSEEHGVKDPIAVAKQLIINHKDNLFGLHGLAYWLGSKSFEYFNMYFLKDVFTGNGKAEISKTHKEIWRELQDIILNKKTDKKLYICPRGFGKTTFISQSSAIWSALYKFKRYIILCSAVGDTANAFVNNIKIALKDNKRIEAAFGQIYDPKHFTNNTEIIDLANTTRIQSISASSVFRGKNFGNIRPELVILDDYQKDDEVATDEQREKKWQRFQNDVMKSIQKNTCTLLACGTIQHKECFYSRLYNDPTWLHRFEKGVLTDNVDELFNSELWEQFKAKLFNIKDENRLENAKNFYYEHEEEMQYSLLWSEYWNCLDYALDYYSNPISFKQEIQNDVNNIGEKRFTTIITETTEQMEQHEFEKTMLCVDPASSGADNKKADFTAFVIGSKSYNNIKYCRKGEIYKFKFDDYINHTIELLKKYKDITHVYIEKNLYMGADIIRLKELISKDSDLCNRDFEFINEMQRKNKIDKIDSIVGDVNFGRVIFNEEDKDALLQLKDYQGITSLHDDFPDVLSEFVIRVDNIKTISCATFLDKRLLF